MRLVILSQVLQLQSDNGKVDSHTLRNTSYLTLETEFDTPINPTEETLVAIWAEVLGLKQIGIHDNFFALGGHSLLAMRMFTEIEKNWGTRLSLATLFSETDYCGTGDCSTPRRIFSRMGIPRDDSTGQAYKTASVLYSRYLG